jgi:hypothetical protein
MKNMKIITLLAVFLFSSCSKWILTSTQIDFPKYGSEKLLTGFKDGCETSHNSRGNSLHRMFFKYRFNAAFATDAEYYTAWTRGYNTCFHIINRQAFGSIDSNITPEHGKWFWNRTGKHQDPKIDWFWNQGVDIDLGAGKGKAFKLIPGEGHDTVKTIFQGCNGIWRGC